MKSAEPQFQPRTRDAGHSRTSHLSQLCPSSSSLIIIILITNTTGFILFFFLFFFSSSSSHPGLPFAAPRPHPSLAQVRPSPQITTSERESGPPLLVPLSPSFPLLFLFLSRPSVPLLTKEKRGDGPPLFSFITVSSILHFRFMPSAHSSPHPPCLITAWLPCSHFLFPAGSLGLHLLLLSSLNPSHLCTLPDQSVIHPAQLLHPHPASIHPCCPYPTPHSKLHSLPCRSLISIHAKVSHSHHSCHVQALLALYSGLPDLLTR